jgi:hypothetical protein
VTIGADGYSSPAAAETINVNNVTTSASLGTLVSDADGYIDHGSLAGTAGDIIELSHATYTEILRLRLGSSIEDAYDRNRGASYVLEDLYLTIPAKNVEIYVQDRSAPDDAPRYIGTAPIGENYKIPITPITSKTMRVFPLAVDALNNRSITTFDTDNFEDVSVVARGPQTLFDHHADETTAGTSEEVLYTDTIAGQTLFYTDDKITAEYAGVFAATADDKIIILDFAGQELFNSGVVVENAKDWKLNLTMFRVSNTTVRFVVQFSTSVHWEPVYGVLTGLDLYDGNALVLSADDEVAGGTTAKIAHALLIPAVELDTDYVTWLGTVVTYLGEPVTYP